jgi:hypothetical protein
LGIGDWAQSPIPNPQSPIPNPQSPFLFVPEFNILIINNIKNNKIRYLYLRIIKNKRNGELFFKIPLDLFSFSYKNV